MPNQTNTSHKLLREKRLFSRHEYNNMKNIINELLGLILKNIEISKRFNKIGTVQYAGMLNKKQKKELESKLETNKFLFKYDETLDCYKIYWK